MNPSVRVQVQKTLDKILSGHFDENNVDSLLMGLRAYNSGHRIFREIADFVAHNTERDQGMTNRYLNGFYLSLKYFVEYEIPRKTLTISNPFPSYIKHLMMFQVDKCDPAVLHQKFQITPKELKAHIDKIFKEDKKTKTAVPRKTVKDKTLQMIKHVLGFLSLNPLFTADEFMDDLMGVLHANNFHFPRDSIMTQRGTIIICLMLLMHKTEFTFAGIPPCKIFINFLPHSLESSENNVGETLDKIPTNTLLLSGLVGIPNDAHQSTAIIPIMRSDLSVFDYCDERLIAIGKKGTLYPDICIFDQDLLLTQKLKLGLIHAQDQPYT